MQQCYNFSEGWPVALYCSLFLPYVLHYSPFIMCVYFRARVADRFFNGYLSAA